MLARCLVAMVALMVWCAPVHANWSLGANLGVQVFSADAPDQIVYVSAPSAVGLYAGGLHPGLRFGFGEPEGANLIHLDAGITSLFVDGASLKSVMVTGNIQHNFSPMRPDSPYLTAGAGVLYAGDDRDSAASLVAGFGLGIRHRLAHGKGTLRGEIRFDRVTEGEDAGDLVTPEGNVLGLRFGFDLWMR